jgi:hypothetical protein
VFALPDGEVNYFALNRHRYASLQPEPPFGGPVHVLRSSTFHEMASGSP